ncbi:lamin tail domain-containing protein [Patescibacteria group bacterium]|nr:lamin tail domain-containing protein [Patescibacteria group bacterium]
MRLVLILIFLVLFALPIVAFASVVINEVAWMGSNNGGTSLQDANDEWIELKNTGSESVDLSGWILQATDEKPNIILGPENCTNTILTAGSYFLLERTNDATVVDIAADCIYTGALSNAGEILILKNALGAEVDRVDGSNKWEIGGDNETKETLQRTSSGWVTARATPKAQNTGIFENQTLEQQPLTQDQPTTISNSPASKLVQTTEKKIMVDAGYDRVVVVGAATKFEGNALGFKNEPLTGADFLWNFGDGSLVRGRVVIHTYQYPGTYNVDLNVSTGEISAAGRIKVTAIPAPIAISELKPGVGGWIELANDSEFDIDLSHWSFGSGVLTYSLPAGTKILTGVHTVIPYEISGIAFLSLGRAFLFYPNGKLVQEFRYSGEVNKNESFHNIQGKAKIGLESPGSARFVARASRSSRTVLPASFAPVAQKSSGEDSILIKKEPSEQNLASVKTLPKRNSFFKGSMPWFAAALGIGLLSALSYLFIKRKGFL